jgi:hypothetical protein
MKTQKKLDSAIVLMIFGISLMFTGFLCTQVQPKDKELFYDLYVCGWCLESRKAYQEHLDTIATIRGIGSVSEKFGLGVFAAATVWFAIKMKRKED